jgi:hypothetical protein
VVASTMDPLGWLRKHMEAADTDLLREMVLGFVQALMSAEADAACGAALGERSAERVNQRNGYRERRLDTRVGSLELAIPSCGPAATTLGGCWSPAGGASAPSWRWWLSAMSAGSPPAGSRGWWRPLASRACRSHRSLSSPRPLTSRWPRSALGRWTPVPTRTCGWTPWRSSAARPAGSSTCPAWSPPGSTPTATASSSAWTC